jgi:hypothetical protein
MEKEQQLEAYIIKNFSRNTPTNERKKTSVAFPLA